MLKLKGKSKREKLKRRRRYIGQSQKWADVWKAATSSFRSKRRGKNEPTILEIDKLLSNYDAVKDDSSRMAEQRQYLQDLNRTLTDWLSTYSGSRRNAAEELQQEVQDQLADLPPPGENESGLFSDGSDSDQDLALLSRSELRSDSVDTSDSLNLREIDLASESDELLEGDLELLSPREALHRTLSEIRDDQQKLEPQKRADLISAFREAGALDRLTSPYLVRHTNNTQMIQASPAQAASMSMDQAKAAAKELGIESKDFLDDFIEDLQDGLDGERVALINHYYNLILLKADIRLTVFNGINNISNLSLAQQPNYEELNQQMEDLNGWIGPVDNALKEILDLLEKEDDWQQDFVKMLSQEQKWKLSTLATFDQDSIFKKNHPQGLLAALNEADPDEKQRYDQVLSKPNRFIQNTIDSNDQQTLFLEALTDMVLNGGDVGLRLATLALNEELEIVARPMLDSEFISPIEDSSFINPTVLWCPYSKFFNYRLDESGNMQLNVYPSWLTLLHELGHYSQSLDNPAQYKSWLESGQVAEIERDNLNRHEAVGATHAGLTPRLNYEDHIFEIERFANFLEEAPNGVNLDALRNLPNNSLDMKIKRDMWRRHYAETMSKNYDDLLGSVVDNEGDHQNLFEEVSDDEKQLLYEFMGEVQAMHYIRDRPPRRETVLRAVELGEEARNIAKKYNHNQTQFAKMMSFLLVTSTLAID